MLKEVLIRALSHAERNIMKINISILATSISRMFKAPARRMASLIGPKIRTGETKFRNKRRQGIQLGQIFKHLEYITNHLKRSNSPAPLLSTKNPQAWTVLKPTATKVVV